MEVDFDKEIDALLRKARHDGPVLVGDAAMHLDADEIAAFAENALPEKSRGSYTLHLAECDRCRKILSNLLVMNSEAVPGAAVPGAITIAERASPWYRKFFLFPNLAYVMGGLVLIFGGFLAFTVIQRSGMSDGAVVSQVAESESTRGGPNFQTEAPVDTQSANSNSAANMASATPLITDSNASGMSAERDVAGPNVRESIVTDNAPTSSTDSIAGVPLAAPPPPQDASLAAAPRSMAVPRPEAKTSDNEAPKEETRNSAGSAATAGPMKDSMLAKQRADANVQAQSGPSRNSEQNYYRQLENLDKRDQARKRAATEDEAPAGRRVVGGRTFERKQGVWYDIAYQSRPTINVRRGSEEFNRLDGGLRSIANSLSGTIVVVWGAKAYRIQ